MDVTGRLGDWVREPAQDSPSLPVPPSPSRLLVGSTHSDEPSGCEFLLPDRNRGLDSVDGGAAGGEGFGAVGGGRDDGDGDFTHLEPSRPVLHRKARVRPFRLDLAGDPGHLGLRHRSIDLVLDGDCLPSLVLVSHDAQKDADAAVGGTCRAQERRDVNRAEGDVHDEDLSDFRFRVAGSRISTWNPEPESGTRNPHPPATGGRNATSSPSRRTVSPSTYVWLTAAGGIVGKAARRGISRETECQSWPTRVPSGSSRLSSAFPAASRKEAK